MDKSSICNSICSLLTLGNKVSLLIEGESGSGKTMSIRQAAKQSSTEIVFVQLTAETTLEQLLGNFVVKEGALGFSFNFF